MSRFFAAMLAFLPLGAMGQESGAAGAAPATPAPASASPGGRSGVYMGFGAGVSATSELGGGGGEYRIRIGAARSPRLLFGFEAGLTAGERDTLSFYDAGATFFPWRRIFFLRAAAGLSSGTREDSAVQGVNLLLGLGAAVGATRGVNVTLNLEAINHLLVQSSSAGGYNVSGASAWLGLEWL